MDKESKPNSASTSTKNAINSIKEWASKLEPIKLWTAKPNHYEAIELGYMDTYPSFGKTHFKYADANPCGEIALKPESPSKATYCIDRIDTVLKWAMVNAENVTEIRIHPKYYSKITSFPSSMFEPGTNKWKGVPLVVSHDVEGIEVIL